ncbi:unnamed protein product [[Candida] boidinii]|nr:unnamed protein product [[Candida] boidinii]
MDSSLLVSSNAEKLALTLSKVSSNVIIANKSLISSSLSVMAMSGTFATDGANVFEDNGANVLRVGGGANLELE